MKYSPAVLKRRILGLSAIWFLAQLPVLAQSTTPSFLFTHFAGTTGGAGFVDGSGSAARFRFPEHLTLDKAGNIYVADTYNETIRKITPSGMVTTLAGSAGQSGSIDGTGSTARFNSPSSAVTDSSGNIYVADSANNTIRKINPTGIVTTLAGSSGQSGNDDGAGAAARFQTLTQLVVNSANIIYAADRKIGNDQGLIRTITPLGTVSTLVVTDGSGSPITFNGAVTMTFDQADNLFVVVTDGRLYNSFYRITPAGIAIRLTGAGYDSLSDGTIGGIAIDAAGNLYFAAPYNSTGIIQISPAGVSTKLGNGLNHPFGVAVDQSANVYVAVSDDHTVNKITPTGATSGIAGMAAEGGSADGMGTAARFRFPGNLALDNAGNIFVADVNNCTIRKISPAGMVTTLAGMSQQAGSNDGTGSAARFGYIFGLTTDSAGNLLVADAGYSTIRKVTPTGVVTTLAGSPGQYSTNIDGKGSDARFDSVHGAAMDRNGNLYVAGRSTIRKISPTGDVSTIAGSSSQTGTADGNTTDARFFQPSGLTVDKADNIIVADSYNNTIRRISPAGDVSTIAGAPGQEGATDGIGTAARFSSPGAMTMDDKGNLYIADSGNDVIRLMTPDGTVSTLGGKAKMSGSEDGIGSAARFYALGGITLDQSGNLYVADVLNNTIRKGLLAGPPVITTQPQNVSVSPGGTAQFSVTASGAPEPIYQWYFNGNAFSGATNNTLSFTNARSTDAGDYTVVVTNSLGSATSSKATLTVTAAPTTPTPASSPSSGSSGGGGSIEAWFAIMLSAMAVLRSLRCRDEPKDCVPSL